MDKSVIATIVFATAIAIYCYNRFVLVQKRYKEINKLRLEYFQVLKEDCRYDLANKKVIWHRRFYHTKERYCCIHELYDLGNSKYALVFYRKKETEHKIPIEVKVEEMTLEEANRFMTRQSKHKMHRLRNFICKREE